MDEYLTMRCPKCNQRVTLRLDIPSGNTFEYANIEGNGQVVDEHGKVIDDAEIILFCPCTQKRIPAIQWSVQEN